MLRRIAPVIFAALSFSSIAFVESTADAQQTPRPGRTALSQPTNDAQNPDAAGQVGTDGKAVNIQETFQSAFLIEPLVQRLSGRSGTTLSFKFKLESLNRETRIDILPVGLKQEITGRISVDQSKEISSNVLRLLTPNAMTLLPGVTSFIEGVVQIPRGDSEFHTLGLLIREVGQENNLKPTVDAAGNVQTKAGLQITTQYLLRIDLLVEGVRGGQAAQIILDDLKLSPFRGRPQLNLIATNPTASAVEFEMRARLRRSANDRSFQPLRLNMPIRNDMETEEKFVGRLLPKSRVRMQGLLPEAIASGDYEVDLDILVAGRTAKKQTLSIKVNAADFPAQDVIISQAAEGLMIAPAQIELAQTRGGVRRVSLSLTNNSRNSKSIDLSAVDRSGQQLTGVTIQPSQVSLPPGSNRKLSIIMKGSSGTSLSVEYGSLRVVTQSDERDFTESKELPLALVYKNLRATEVSVEPVVWDPGDDLAPRFRTLIRNIGESHLPVDARLSINGSSGFRDTLHGGFGKWLMPGESMWINFAVEKPLPPGDYVLRFEMQTGTQPISTSQTFQVTDLVTASR
ncbi:MAG TPA: hypothetical protein DDZ51_01495 [Planctomycetaceae bacterium]|nr:hypothetical protein [Planctomycetaceae bacterium]